MWVPPPRLLWCFNPDFESVLLQSCLSVFGAWGKGSWSGGLTRRDGGDTVWSEPADFDNLALVSMSFMLSS
jgi:hypothetical protein